MNGMKSFVVVVATGLLTLLVLLLLWGLRGTLDECCKTMQEKMTVLQKTADEIKARGVEPPPPPGKGPDISVGPGGGTQAAWSLDGSPVTGFDSHHRIRSDAWGAWVHFYFKPPNSPGAEINKFKIKIESGGVERTIMITKSVNGQIGWTLDGVPIDQCDYKQGGYADCENQGLPSEFNGTIRSMTYELAGTWSGELTGEAHSQAQW